MTFRRKGGAIRNYTGLKSIIKRSYQGFPDSSAAKESSCNAGDLHSWRRNRQPTPLFLGFSGGSDSQESACNAGDLGFILG